MICNECPHLAIDPILSDYSWCLCDGENIYDIYDYCRFTPEVMIKKEAGDDSK